MSLYATQKLLYQLNRDPKIQARYKTDLEQLLDQYELSKDERKAFKTADLGLLYVLGVNGQILMHYAAFLGIEWTDYLNAMRNGVTQHGPVRAGLYALTTKMNQA